MLCPISKTKLQKAIFYGVETDYCPDCLGIWFEEEELRWAKDAKDKDLKWLDIDLWKDDAKFKINRGIRLCPLCRLPLYEVYYGSTSSPQAGDSKIVVDLCNLCHGIWLDRGEFKKIIEYLKKEAGWKVLNRYAKAFSEEFWEIFSGPESLKEETLDFLTILKLLSYKFVTQHPNLTKIISELPR